MVTLTVAEVSGGVFLIPIQDLTNLLLNLTIVNLKKQRLSNIP